MELPSGIVTFLFTDVEGSTKLWEDHTRLMEQSQARHVQIIEGCVERHSGVLIQSRGEGDSTFSVFTAATDAVAAACALQRALHAEPWPPEVPIRVRAALHAGAATPERDDYHAPDVNRCARLRAIGHGGQTLLSRSVYLLACEALPEGAGLHDLGLHRLKDLQRPEQVYQLLHRDLPAAFPPLLSLNARRTNLPLQLTSFVGRSDEIAAIKQRLPGTRLLTLTGFGGCGKTRLALQVAAESLEEHPDGVWLVELAALSDPALVVQTVASVLGMSEQPGIPLQQTLIDNLKSKKLLLILDNCEHLIEECGAITGLFLRSCSDLKILATSREVLNLPGERIWNIPPMPPPPDEEALRQEADYVAAVMESDAAQLFVERATLHSPEFRVSRSNALAVAQICRQLDGIPLAIELAAARVRVLAVEQIAKRLSDMFQMLTGGGQTLLPRQRTLRALIDWSYDLLTEMERVLIRRLSVFAGGWTLDAAEAICRGDSALGGSIGQWDVLDLLTRLIDKSLVIFEERPGQGRYRMLEPVRQYAGERLAEVGEAQVMRECHLLYVVTMVEGLEARLCVGVDQVWWFHQLEPEQDNVRAALDWCRADGHSAEPGLRLASAYTVVWYMLGHFTEGVTWMESLLAKGGEVSPSARGKALCAVGYLSFFLDEQGRAKSHAYMQQSVTTLREADDRWNLAVTLNLMGNISLYDGKFSEVKAAAEEGLLLARQQDNPLHVAFSIFLLGFLASLNADWERAEELLEESTRIWRGIGNLHFFANALIRLGDVKQRQGRYEEARTHYIESLESAHGMGIIITILRAFQGLAQVMAAQGAAERSAQLLSATDTLKAALHISMPPFDIEIFSRTTASVRAALGEGAFQGAWDQGTRMSLEEAIAFSMEANQ